ncbi:MAG: single-stranded DNA-binding protein [Firmicutes bacterium]|nr:single-stranded DNA-binding protein [Bacillota bacterium]
MQDIQTEFKMQDNKGSNTVSLIGEVISEPEFSHKVFGEGFYETHLKVSRLSDQYDIIPITVSDRLMQNVPLNVGRIVSVEGQFRSYNKITESRSKLMLTVFVRELECGESVLDKNPNHIELTGYICKPPVFRTTPFKREICDVLLAVNRAYNKSDYIPCIAWGRNARFAQSLNVGAKVVLFGRVQSREYQKQLNEEEAETRTAYEISIARISLADYNSNEE